MDIVSMKLLVLTVQVNELSGEKNTYHKHTRQKVYKRKRDPGTTKTNAFLETISVKQKYIRINRIASG